MPIDFTCAVNSYTLLKSHAYEIIDQTIPSKVYFYDRLSMHLKTIANFLTTAF